MTGLISRAMGRPAVAGPPAAAGPDPAAGLRSATPLLSVIVITKNEVANLGRCLRSAAFADEWVVVDSGSTDGTQALARSLGARLVEPPDWPGFGAQKQRALDAARGTWVLSLDADEWLDETLAAAVQQAVRQAIQQAVQDPEQSANPTPSPDAFEVTRLSAFCGQWMRASGWYPDRGVRLFRRGAARFSSDLVHEHLELTGRATSTIPRLPGLLLHNSIPTLENAIDKMNRYSSGRARDLQAKGRRGSLASALGHGLWAFLRTYLLKRGFLDGQLGLVLALHNAETTYYRYLKLWLLQQGERPLPPAPQRDSGKR